VTSLRQGSIRAREAEHGGGGRQEAASGAAVVASPSFAGAQLSPGEFASAFERIRDAVQSACAGQTQWEQKIRSGVCAVLDFVARDPQAARALTYRAADRGRGADSVIAYFSKLLDDATPDGRPYGVSTDQAIVESLAGVVRAHVRSGTADRLPGMAPELVLLTLLPYTMSHSVGVSESSAALDLVH
jgi:hypothetical protein